MNDCGFVSSDKIDADCKLEENLTELISTFKAQWPVERWKRLGLFNDDYLLKINIYWLKFPPPSPISHYVLGALYIVIMIIGITGNFLIIIMFSSPRCLDVDQNNPMVDECIDGEKDLIKTFLGKHPPPEKSCPPIVPISSPNLLKIFQKKSTLTFESIVNDIKSHKNVNPKFMNMFWVQVDAERFGTVKEVHLSFFTAPEIKSLESIKPPQSGRGDSSKQEVSESKNQP